MRKLLLGSVLILGCTVTLCGADKFVLSCPVPFAPIQTTGLDIDKSCPVGGGSDDPAKQAESTAKNNFCAPGKPVVITYPTFKKLEA